MSHVRHVRLVAGRELIEAFRSTAYRITIGVFVLVVGAGIVLPRLFVGDTIYEVGLAGEVPEGLAAELDAVVQAFDASLEVASYPDLEADETPLIRRDRSSETLVGIANQVVTSASARALLLDAGLDESIVVAALAPTPPTEVRVDLDESGRLGVAWITGLVLYLAILLGGMSVAQGVAIEKSTRIAEVLVTSVRPSRLLAGKVLGLGVSALLIVLAGAVPFAAAIAIGWVDVSSAAALEVVAGIGWFLLGYSIYATVFGALGALVDRQEDLGVAVGPLSTILVLSYLATNQAAGAPGSTVARVVSVVPFSAPMVMPVRIGAGSATTLEVVAAVGLGLATLLVLAQLGGVIYRRALLRGGQRLSLAQVLRG